MSGLMPSAVIFLSSSHHVGLFNQVSGMISESQEQKIMSRIETTKETIEHVNAQFKGM